MPSALVFSLAVKLSTLLVALALLGCNRRAPTNATTTTTGAEASAPQRSYATPIVAGVALPELAPAEHSHTGGSDPDDHPEGVTQPASDPPAGMAVATFAGGCFWCMEYAFERVRGVRDAISGYTGGTEQHPTYEAVSNHETTQAEAIRVIYDPAVVSYPQLLEIFWRHIEPTARDRAFSDEGRQYRSAIYVHSAEQRAAAQASLSALSASRHFSEPIVTPIEDAGVFWVAESYHQNFYRTHPQRFHQYHEASGRREFLQRHWGPDADY